MENLFEAIQNKMMFSLTVGILIIRLFSLSFFKNGLEIKLMHDSKRILIYVSRALITSLFGAILIIELLEIITEDSLGNYPLNEALYIFLVAAFIFLFAYYIIGMLLFALNAKHYYIMKDDAASRHGKLYILKASDHHTIVLCNHRRPASDSEFVLCKRESLYDENIYVEKENSVKDFIKWIKNT